MDLKYHTPEDCGKLVTQLLPKLKNKKLYIVRRYSLRVISTYDYDMTIHSSYEGYYVAVKVKEEYNRRGYDQIAHYYNDELLNMPTEITAKLLEELYNVIKEAVFSDKFKTCQFLREDLVSDYSGNLELGMNAIPELEQYIEEERQKAINKINQQYNIGVKDD